MSTSLKRLLGLQPQKKKPDLDAIVVPTHVRVAGQVECANVVKSPLSGLTAAAFRVEVGYAYVRHNRNTSLGGDGVSMHTELVPSFDTAYGETLVDNLAVRVGDKRILVSAQNLEFRGGDDAAMPIGTVTLPPRFEGPLCEAPWPESTLKSSVSDVALSFREYSLSDGDGVVLDATVARRDDGVFETRPELGGALLAENAADLPAEPVASSLFNNVLAVIFLGVVVLVEVGRVLHWW